MVAYNFKAQFEAQIASGSKRQTVRKNRSRHARVGETIQLYIGQRQMYCRKIRPDVVCLAVHDIEICTSRLIDEVLASIAIDGHYLSATNIEAFAKADGFELQHRTNSRPHWTRRYAMGQFFLNAYGEGRFTGKLIMWGPAPERGGVPARSLSEGLPEESNKQ